MKIAGRDFRVLDKDLGSITHVEKAQMHAIRPVLRLGGAILMLIALWLLVLGVTGHEPGLIAVGSALIVAGWLGVAIGANDIANSLGPAFGAGAVRLVPGLILVAIAEVAGAAMAGGPVTTRLAEGIFDSAQLGTGLPAQLTVLSALIAAAAWITIATGAGLPVSTTHSIVGSLAGAGIAMLGAAAVNWISIGIIASAWMLTPLAAAGLAGAILLFVQLNIRDAPDRRAAAQRWLHLLVGVMVGLFVSYLFTLITPGFPLWLDLLPGALAGLAAGWAMRSRVDVMLQDSPDKPRMTSLFRPALLFSAVMMAFAHGASDASNVAGPLLMILRATDGAAISGVVGVPLLLLVGAGTAIALGAVLFGRRLVVMVGSGITRLNAVRAFCITLATALIVLGATGLGLPVSSTHVAVGGVFGVGFAREWLDRRKKRSRKRLPAEEVRRRTLGRRSHVVTISVAWLVTVPVTALMGATCCWLVLWVMGV